MKAAVAISGDTSITNRKAVMDELESLIRHYLHDAITVARYCVEKTACPSV
jgi:hypothetical protein